MKILVIICSVIFSANSFSCLTDYDCGYGNRCVKPAGSYSMRGTCVVPTNEYGQRDYSSSYNGWGSKSEPTNVVSCQFNTDCGIGYACLKEAGQIYGICSK